MKQLKKSELLKRVDDAYIFGDEKYITVDEFCFNGKDSIVATFRVFKGGLVELIKSDILDASRAKNQLEFNIDNFKSTVRINYIKNVFSIYSEKISTEYSNSTSTKITRSVCGDLVYDCNMDNPILGQVIYTNSFIAPVVRICKAEKFKLDDILSFPIINLSQFYTSKIKNLLFNSLILPMKVQTEEIKTSESIYPIMSVEDRVNAVFVNSSLSREKVVYDEDGMVIKYTNPMNRIKMTREKNNTGFIRKVYFEDHLLVYDSFSKVNNIVTEIHYDIIKGCIKYTDNGETRDMVPFPEFLDNIKVPKKKVENNLSARRETISFFNDKDELFGMVTVRFDDENSIAELYLFSKEKNTEGVPVPIISTSYEGGGMFKMDNYYRLNVYSESGIRTSSICFDNKLNLETKRINIKEYKDNDIHLNIDENGMVEQYGSNLLDNGDLIYVRDIFGIPELYYRKVKGEYQKV